MEQFSRGYDDNFDIQWWWPPFASARSGYWIPAKRPSSLSVSHFSSQSSGQMESDNWRIMAHLFVSPSVVFRHITHWLYLRKDHHYANGITPPWVLWKCCYWQKVCTLSQTYLFQQWLAWFCAWKMAWRGVVRVPATNSKNMFFFSSAVSCFVWNFSVIPETPDIFYFFSPPREFKIQVV